MKDLVEAKGFAPRIRVFESENHTAEDRDRYTKRWSTRRR